MTHNSQLTVHMRLFAAVDLSDDARAAIAAEQQRIATDLGAAARSLRFVRAGQMHLTLAFIGEIAEDRAASIVDVMGNDVARAPFQLVLGGVGTFPPGGAPRVLWLGVVRGAEEHHRARRGRRAPARGGRRRG